MSKGRVVALPPIFPLHHPASFWVHLPWPYWQPCLSIPLWISQGEITICNAQVTTVPPEGFTIKLKTIVRDGGMRDPKSGDNIFLNKSLGIHVFDICHWFSFKPLGEVICADQQPSLIPCYLRERPYNIQALLSKKPRAGQMIEVAPQLMNV